MQQHACGGSWPYPGFVASLSLLPLSPCFPSLLVAPPSVLPLSRWQCGPAAPAGPPGRGPGTAPLPHPARRLYAQRDMSAQVIQANHVRSWQASETRMAEYDTTPLSPPPAAMKVAVDGAAVPFAASCSSQ